MAEPGLDLGLPGTTRARLVLLSPRPRPVQGVCRGGMRCSRPLLSDSSVFSQPLKMLAAFQNRLSYREHLAKGHVPISSQQPVSAEKEGPDPLPQFRSTLSSRGISGALTEPAVEFPSSLHSILGPKLPVNVLPAHLWLTAGFLGSLTCYNVWYDPESCMMERLGTSIHGINP